MAEDQDLERRLDSMFESLRPSAAFAQELRRRLSRPRPAELSWWARLAGSRPLTTRLAPALAAFIVVAGGTAYLVSHRPAQTASRSSSAAAPAYSATASFGKLPRPGFAAGKQMDHSAGTALAPSQQGNAAPYQFIGSLPSLPPTAAIYRYSEPDAQQRNRVATELSASSGLAVAVTPSRAGAGLPPTFTADSIKPAPATDQDVAKVGSAVLRAHNLTPKYATREVVGNGSVIFAREFQLGPGRVLLIDANGSPIGVQVSLGSQLARISGPVELPLASASYPLRSGAEAVTALNSGPPPSGGSPGRVLDRAELVYVVVNDGTWGYLEPAVRFSGAGGAVLVPAVDADHLIP